MTNKICECWYVRDIYALTLVTLTHDTSYKSIHTYIHTEHIQFRHNVDNFVMLCVHVCFYSIDNVCVLCLVKSETNAFATMYCTVYTHIICKNLFLLVHCLFFHLVIDKNKINRMNHKKQNNLKNKVSHFFQYWILEKSIKNYTNIPILQFYGKILLLMEKLITWN